MTDHNKHSPAEIGKHAGTVLGVIGLLLFFSVFLSAALNFGNFDNFEARGRSMSLRAVFGFLLMIIGGAVHGIATSKGSKQEDQFNDGTWKPESDEILTVPVKIRCPNCRALNDQAAKFCDQCGKNL